MNQNKIPQIDHKPLPLPRPARPSWPVLRFTPAAWAKLQFFCHQGETEIGGFGITSAEDLLLVEDFATIPQAATCVSVAFDDGAVADFFDARIDAGYRPE